MMQRFLKPKKRLLSRHMMGEGLSNLSMKELKNLEGKLERGISRIRSKKVNIKILINLFLFSEDYEICAGIRYWFLPIKFLFSPPL